MERITINGFDIDIVDGPIGISMSGGADSTLLFYMLSKYAKGPIFVFSIGNGRTNYQEPSVALNIVTKLIEQTGREDIYFRSHFVDEKRTDNSYPTEFMAGTNINALYFAFTRPPPKGAITDCWHEEFMAVGSEDHGLTLPIEWKNKNEAIPILGEGLKEAKYDGKILTPFINVNKQTLAELYKFLDIEHLYSLTRSCESLKHIGEQCGKCWYCKERIWAFGKLN